MAGLFELFVDAQSRVRFRLTAPDGTVVAVSKPFEDKPAAVAGIAAVREYAGMGHITDLCPPHSEGLHLRVRIPGSLLLHTATGRCPGSQPNPGWPAPPDRERRHRSGTTAARMLRRNRLPEQ